MRTPARNTAMPDSRTDRAGQAVRDLAVAGVARAAVLAAPNMALAATDTTSGDPLDTVEDIVVGTGSRLAAALAVGASLAGTAIVR